MTFMAEDTEIDEVSITSNTSFLERVAFVNRSGRRPDERQLINILLANQSSIRIRSLYLAPSSHLTTLDTIQPLKQLEELRVGSDHLKDYSGIGGFRKLRQLIVEASRRRAGIPNLSGTAVTYLAIATKLAQEAATIGKIGTLKTLVLLTWPERDLRKLGELHLEELILKSIAIVDVGPLDCSQMHFFRCGRCPHLVSLRGIDSEEVDIEACRKLDLNSVSGNRIRRVVLRNMGRISDVGFLSSCPDLQQIMLTATRLSRSCVPIIAAHKGLREVKLFASGLKREDLRVLSESLQGAMVTDGRDTFKGGVATGDHGQE